MGIIQQLRKHSDGYFLSGYHKLPPKKLYWEGKSDVAVKLIADNFRRNGFDSTMRILHSANNLEMSDDRRHKVRPLFDIQNAAFKRRKVTPGRTNTVDITQKSNSSEENLFGMISKTGQFVLMMDFYTKRSLTAENPPKVLILDSVVDLM